VLKAGIIDRKVTGAGDIRGIRVGAGIIAVIIRSGVEG
jgi:hypothetical protein